MKARHQHPFMRMMICCTMVIACVANARNADAVAFSAGDAIKLDFSAAGNGDGGSLADWNVIANNTTLAAGSVLRHGGGTVDGVSVSFGNMVLGNFNNDGASANWPGTAADPYYVLAADDIYFHGNAADIQVTINGLDPSLDYNVRFYSLINNNGGSVERFVATDGAGTRTSQVTRATRFGAAQLEAGGSVLNGLKVNGSNQLVVSVEDVSSAFYPLNAIVIEATKAFDPTTLWSVDIAGGPTGNGFGDAVPQAKSGIETNYGRGNIWNQYFVKAFDNVSAAPAPNQALVDSAGNASGVQFQILGNVQGWPGDPGQGTDPLRRDYLFLNAGQSANQVAWEITGLLAGGIYELYAYGGATRSMNLFIDQTGEAATFGAGGFLFRDITADSLGRITGIAGDGPGGPEQNWAGFQLRLIAAPIPEPATMSLLALTAVGGLRRRRRCA
ncbi:MAG: PEP-CTERM sorting domain-containing protein [Phycisphaeraceae bacterium]